MTNNFCSKEYKELLPSVQDINSCPKVPLPQIGSDQNYIFISYSHEDFKQVYSDIADMYEAGVRFWYDRGLSAGKKWDEEVEERILDPHCVGVIFYISKHFFLSKSACREVEITVKHQEAPSGKDCAKNYFCVNLSNQLPFEILTSAMMDNGGRPLDMRQISILSQAFPDEATYLNFSLPDHIETLISQIQNQFGVVDKTAPAVVLETDQRGCDVYASSSEKLTDPDRQALLRKLQAYLNSKGISFYVEQSFAEISAQDAIAQNLTAYTDRQNKIKLESANFVLLISTTFGWTIHAQLFREFDASVTSAKTLLYLIDDPSISIEEFETFYAAYTETPQWPDVKSRLFFASDETHMERIAAFIANHNSEPAQT